MIRNINKFLSNKKGQGLVEYALILVLIVVVALVFLGVIGNNVSTAFSSANTSIGTAVAG